MLYFRTKGRPNGCCCTTAPDDFRKQIEDTVDLEMLAACADRYGDSLTATILKWLEFTDESAVVVMSNDGFIDWAWSSERAWKAGAFFKTRGNVVPVPAGSLGGQCGCCFREAGANNPDDYVVSPRRGRSPCAGNEDSRQALRQSPIFTLVAAACERTAAVEVRRRGLNQMCRLQCFVTALVPLCVR